MNILIISNYRPQTGGISGQVDLLQEHLQAEGHRVQIFSTKGSAWRRLSLPWKILPAAQRADVLHVHCCSGWGFLPALLGLWAGWAKRRRVVLTYHGGGAKEFFSSHRHIVRFALRHTHCNIVLNEYLHTVFSEFGVPCMIIPNIIDSDPSRFHPRQPFSPKYICTRAHEELYRIPIIIHAFSRVRQQYPEAELTLVGTGSEHEKLRRMVDERGEKNVLFTGRVDHSSVQRLIDAADIMVSAPAIDNMPVSLMEAMESGALVVSSAVGGVNNLIEHGRTGLLFESGDEEALVSMMLRPLEHPEEALHLTQEAHRELQRYQWSAVREKILHAFGLDS